MADERPQTVIQATGAVAQDVVSSLKAQPILLVIVLLNILMCVTAAWFLAKLAENNSKEKGRMFGVIEACLNDARVRETKEKP